MLFARSSHTLFAAWAASFDLRYDSFDGRTTSFHNNLCWTCQHFFRRTSGSEQLGHVVILAFNGAEVTSRLAAVTPTASAAVPTIHASEGFFTWEAKMPTYAAEIQTARDVA